MKKVENLYHKGQDHIWDGKRVLSDLFKEHRSTHLALEDSVKNSLHRVFSVILDGEEAAWKISSALSIELEDEEGRMAATSQAHDEARHYYVMRDYLKEIGVSEHINVPRSSFLESVMFATSVEKKLLGMQLMVEPLALTVFKLVRELNVEPVLTNLLVLFERDEARHVAFGTLYLPKLLQEMSFLGKMELLRWQFAGYQKQFKLLFSLKQDLINIGISPRRAYELARKKQVAALDLLEDGMGKRYPLMDLMLKVLDVQAELYFPK